MKPAAPVKRIVFDSNVWIAALVASAGTSRNLVEEALRFCEVFVSPYLLEEVDRVLARKIGVPPQERHGVRHWLENVCHLVEPPPRKGLSCRDPKDLPILWLAVAVHADLLVTGDRDLLLLKELQGIKVIPPALFWRSL